MTVRLTGIDCLRFGNWLFLWLASEPPFKSTDRLVPHLLNRLERYDENSNRRPRSFLIKTREAKGILLGQLVIN